MTRARATQVLLALVVSIPGGVCLASPPGAGPLRNAAQFRLGGFFPSGDSELWDANESVFTLERSDFDTVELGFTYVHSLSNHFEIGVNLEFRDATALSADRDFREAGTGALIFHDTTIRSTPLTFDLRLIPGGRYRIRGEHQRYVLKPVFYLGAGAGIHYWEYEEIGDFVDDTDPNDPFIFFDRFMDSGTDLEYHALAGLEFPLDRRFGVLVEGRYSWSDADPDASYSRFFLGPTRLDLGGTSVYAGFAYRF